MFVAARNCAKQLDGRRNWRTGERLTSRQLVGRLSEFGAESRVAILDSRGPQSRRRVTAPARFAKGVSGSAGASRSAGQSEPKWQQMK